MTGAGRATGWLLAVPVVCLTLGCSRDTSDAGPRAAAAVAAIALQSDEFKAQRTARMLPVELDYELSGTLAGGQSAVLDMVLRTSLVEGVLEVNIGVPPGVTLAGPTQRRFDLATASRPLRMALELAPAATRAAVQRPLTVDVATRRGGERLTRTFRIALPAPVDRP